MKLAILYPASPPLPLLLLLSFSPSPSLHPEYVFFLEHPLQLSAATLSFFVKSPQVWPRHLRAVKADKDA